MCARLAYSDSTVFQTILAQAVLADSVELGRLTIHECKQVVTRVIFLNIAMQRCK